MKSPMEVSLGSILLEGNEGDRKGVNGGGNSLLEEQIFGEISLVIGLVLIMCCVL